MIYFEILLLLILVGCAVAVAFTKELIPAVIVFTAFSLVMSLLWVILQAPDVAITEAAVGAGISSILFYVVLRNMNKLEENSDERK